MQREEYKDLDELRDSLIIAQSYISDYPDILSKYNGKYKEIDKIYTQIMSLFDKIDKLLGDDIGLAYNKDNED